MRLKNHRKIEVILTARTENEESLKRGGKLVSLMKAFLRRDLHKEKKKKHTPMKRSQTSFPQLPSLTLMFTKGQVIIKGKVMGIINPGRRRRKRLQSLKDEGTRRPLLRGNGKDFRELSS